MDSTRYDHLFIGATPGLLHRRQRSDPAPSPFRPPHFSFPCPPSPSSFSFSLSFSSSFPSCLLSSPSLSSPRSPSFPPSLPPSPSASLVSSAPPLPLLLLLLDHASAAPLHPLPLLPLSFPSPLLSSPPIRHWDDDWSAHDDDLLLSLKCNERLRPSWQYVARKMQRPLSQVQARWIDLNLQRVATS